MEDYIDDKKTIEDRLHGKRYKPTWEEVATFIVTLALVGLSAHMLSTQMVEYGKGFATTKEQQIAKFYPLPDVPMYKYVKTN